MNMFNSRGLRGAFVYSVPGRAYVRTEPGNAFLGLHPRSVADIPTVVGEPQHDFPEVGYPS